MKDKPTFWLWALCSVGGTVFFTINYPGIDLVKTAAAVTLVSAIIVGALGHAVRGKKA